MISIGLNIGILSPLNLTQVKPIFHCDAKTFALGPGVGLDP